MLKIKKYQIGVIGSAGTIEYKYKKPNKLTYKLARDVGILIAKIGGVLLCGGKSGIMQFAAKGAKEFGGVTVGIVKGNKRRVANTYIDIEIVTNALTGADVSPLVMSCDGLIIVGGGAGTLEEMTVAYRNRIPMVALSISGGCAQKYSGKYMDERKTIKILAANTPKKAVNLLLKVMK